jgi:hypothetical protein
MIVGSRVPSCGVSTIRRLAGMTIPVAEPDPDTRRSSDAVAGAGDRSAPARGELRLVAAGERGAARGVPEPGAAPAIVAPARGEGAPARRLRLAAPVQLELVSAREGRGPEVVWASLPERTREMVLMLLARLIGVGAVEEPEA